MGAATGDVTVLRRGQRSGRTVEEAPGSRGVVGVAAAVVERCFPLPLLLRRGLLRLALLRWNGEVVVLREREERVVNEMVWRYGAAGLSLYRLHDEAIRRGHRQGGRRSEAFSSTGRWRGVFLVPCCFSLALRRCQWWSKLLVWSLARRHCLAAIDGRRNGSRSSSAMTRCLAVSWRDGGGVGLVQRARRGRERAGKAWTFDAVLGMIWRRQARRRRPLQGRSSSLACTRRGLGSRRSYGASWLRLGGFAVSCRRFGHQTWFGQGLPWEMVEEEGASAAGWGRRDAGELLVEQKGTRTR